MKTTFFKLNLKKNLLEREIKLTSDGSKTLYVKALDETYHSHHGALQEARHVFIKNGIKRLDFYEINILELGFGSGLNVLVTLEEFLQSEHPYIINYFSIEKYPVTPAEAQELAYDKLFEDHQMTEWYQKIHSVEWESLQEILPNFHLKKIKADFFDLGKIDLPFIDLVYFDCFGARVQPDLWEKPLIELINNKVKSGSLLTTYSSKGSFQRVLKELYFRVEKLEGPKGKREMINAWKN